MKQWTALLLCFCLTGILTACGSTGANESTTEESIVSVQTENATHNEDTETTASQDDEGQDADDTETENAEIAGETADETGESSRMLVAYFSCIGNTAPLTEYVAEITGADIYEIVAEDPYSDDDIDYSVDDCRANVEQNDETCRPAISGSVENMQDYDIVFIAFPIWWGEEPRIIDTLMESYDFSGTTLTPSAHPAEVESGRRRAICILLQRMKPVIHSHLSSSFSNSSKFNSLLSSSSVGIYAIYFAA